MEIVFGIRPKLRSMNRTLQRLTKAVKYTTMGDIWREIDEGARPVADKYDIVKAAQDAGGKLEECKTLKKNKNMGAWDTILKYGGKAMKGMGKAANATGKKCRSCGTASLADPSGSRAGGQNGYRRSCRRLCGLGKTDHRQKCRTGSSVRP